MELSLRWALRSRAAFDVGPAPEGSAVFGIVQGGMYANCAASPSPDWWIWASTASRSADSPLAKRMLSGSGCSSTPCRMPAGRPRYLMGVGSPTDIVEAVLRGVDMFDCVMPTRHARNGHLFTADGVVRIRNARLPRRPPAHPGGLQLLHLPALQPGLPAASGPVRRDAGGPPEHHT